MAASHFFIGLGAGIAILAVPVLSLTPLDLPHRFVAWIEGPPPRAQHAVVEDAALSRPVHGYRPGDPTPTVEPAPTIKPAAILATSAARHAPAAAQPAGSSMRTGVIRSGGAAVAVRRAPGFESPNDPQLADGSPVLVSTAADLQAGDQQWRAVRGLGGVAGWVPSSAVAVDGEQSPPPPQMAPAATPGPGGQRGMVANTDGAGVVLRNSPNDADRRAAGLFDGTGVTVVERAGNDWVHVRADNGQQGWIPARYLAPTP